MEGVKTVRRGDPEHLKRAFADLGLSEIQGSRHEPRVLQMYALSGNPGIKDDETAWCAAAVGAWLKEAGQPNSGSLMARSYTKYGRDVKALPRIPRGAICVWPRGAPPSGHVNLCLDDDGTFLTCIGGNQGNGRGGGVTINRARKSELLAARMPNALAVVKANMVPQGIADIEPDQDEHERAPQPDEEATEPATEGSWLKRKWKSLTGWFSGASGVGVLGYLTDPWVIVAIIGALFVIAIAFVWFMGPREVRAWIKKQVA